MSRLPFGPQPARPFFRGNGPPFPRGDAPGWFGHSPNAPFLPRHPYARGRGNPAMMGQRFFAPGSVGRGFAGPFGQPGRPPWLGDVSEAMGRPPIPNLMPQDIQPRGPYSSGMRMGAPAFLGAPPLDGPPMNRNMSMMGMDHHVDITPSSKKNQQPCPIKGCTFRSRNIKWHVYSHLPPYFRIPYYDATDVSKLKVKGLRLITQFIVGKGATLKSLVNYVNQHFKFETDQFNISDEIAREIQCIISKEDWPAVTPSMNPVNSPAVLIHWRILAILFQKLTKQQKEELRALQPPLAGFDKPSGSDQSHARLNMGRSVPAAIVDPLQPGTRTSGEMGIATRIVQRQPQPNAGTGKNSDNPTDMHAIKRKWGLSDKEGESAEFLKRQRKSNQSSYNQTCPMNGCTFQDRKVREHVYSHLPKYFHITQDDDHLPDTAKVKVKALNMLAQFILGRRGTLRSLVDYVNKNWQESDIPFAADIHVRRAMEHVISQHNWTPVTPSFKPINTPAALIHWQILTMLFNKLTEIQKTRLFDLEAMIQDARVQAKTPPPPVSGFDAHFYPESLSKRVDKHKEDIALTAGREPEHPVNIVGGVSNYSNPAFFANEQFERMVLSREGSSAWKIAVGINPKQASTVTSAEWSSLVKCLSHPKVVAISDVGFDFRATPDKWRDQEQLFRRILDLGTTGYVLVLYLRGTQDDPAGAVVHKLSRTILGQKCSKHQRIHLHRFAGDAAEVKAWTEMFPNCYFGITGVIRLFSAAQIGGVKAIPPDRLLLETNSPHHKLYPEMVVNTSAFLADLGKLVADVRGVSLEFLMEITLANALRLYGA